MSLENNIDNIYYKNSMNNNFSLSVLLYARNQMFRDFIRLNQPNEKTTILDIGVSDEENEGSNFLEKLYPWKENITCAGIGDGAAIKMNFPLSSFIKITPGERLPFHDNTFDLSYSNAVLEHVGGENERVHFIKENLRVARQTCIFIPHRWFPIEHHTNIPFVHYHPNVFRKITKNSRFDYWSDPKNLDFIDKSSLAKTIKEANGTICHLVYSGIKLGPFSSNVMAIISK